MAILILAEHDNQHFNHNLLNTVTAASQMGEDIHVLVAGQCADVVAQCVARVVGVNTVLLANADHYAHGLAENLAPLVVSVAPNYSHILAPASTFGKNVLPRVAALLDVAPLSEIVAVVSADTFVRPIYAGNVLATLQSTDTVKVITVRATAFDPVAQEGGEATIKPVSALPEPDSACATFVDQTLTKLERPALEAASIVVSGGRALGSEAQFKALMEPLADKLGAAVGASRAAVDAGFAPNDYQVGQTGKVVAPQLYIAIGISGAIQHLAGMKDSKVIVAINKDAEAPIFQIADYGIVGDLFSVVPELIAELSE